MIVATKKVERPTRKKKKNEWQIPGKMLKVREKKRSKEDWGSGHTQAEIDEKTFSPIE